MIKNLPDPQRIHSITCPHCQENYITTHLKAEPKYCVVCGASLKKEPVESIQPTAGESVTLIQGHELPPDAVKFTVGRYQVTSSIGRGGMGEVFLAYDTICGRRIALKKIRDDIKDRPHITTRFLKEARITSQLTHPSIIPIYTINPDTNEVYYTMPFVEGKTLKQILRETKQKEKKKDKSAQGSIQSLLRIFIQVCQAIAYAHSKGVIHRDLKPENIIVGKFGEVLILDWGLAKLMSEEEGPQTETESDSNTRMGKVVGTLGYMPPERTFGVDATFTGDIYALGVILYQILTLKMPFHRPTIKDFKKNAAKEQLIDPLEAAPWREVPLVLSRVVMKCLSKEISERYDSVQKLILELENYVEGRAEFLLIDHLNIEDPKDWEFQENVLIAEHMAITRNVELSDWVNLMISKRSFSENVKLEADFTLKEGSQGIGFLLNVPEPSERRHLNDGFCLWLSTAKGSTKLLKSAYEVLEDPNLTLEANKKYRIKITKIDKNIQVWLNGELELSYISYIPQTGTHIGVITRDFFFEMSELTVYEGSQNILINCLSVPDAFLAHKDYQTALSEYRRIGYSFPGRAEGREAMFRAGITLLEQGLEKTDIESAHNHFDLAFKEFEKLRNTPGAPLEYLGKALVYRALFDYIEEIKSFEMAFRRYPGHPLLNLLEEQIFFRMYESTQTDRQAAYSFILLIIQYLPERLESHPVQKLLKSLIKHAEPLYFMPPLESSSRSLIGIMLSFWLNKPFTIIEIMEASSNPSISEAGWYALKELGFDTTEIEDKLNIEIEKGSEKYQILTLNQALDDQNPAFVVEALKGPLSVPLSCLKISALFHLNKIEQVGQELLHFPLEWHTEETSLLPFLYGCWLNLTEGKDLANIHFNGVMETPYPRTWALGTHFLLDKLPGNWFKKAFYMEKKELWRQLALYYHSINDKEEEDKYFNRIKSINSI